MQQWESCLQFIKDNLDEQTFRTWFKPAKFLSFNNKVVKVQVPSEYFVEYWESHFLKLLKSAFGKCYGKDVSLSYIYHTDNIETTIPISQDSVDIQREKGGYRGPFDPAQTLSPRYPQDLNPDLNPRYTFENFLEGSSNVFPRKIALAIADKFQDTFNPYFIFGHSGVGKTHLANAIGIKIKEQYPQRRVLYLSAHLFCQQYQQASLNKHFVDFMAFYQSIDTLIIDDIQEIAGKEKTQEALFNIFNYLQHNHKQLVFTCDRPPVMLEGLQERLINRFNWGIIAELEAPDAKLRKDIIARLIRNSDLRFPDNVVNYIVSNVHDSVRELEGIINSILAFSIASDCDVNMDLAERTIGRIVNIKKTPVTADIILEKVGKMCKVSNREISSASRKGNIVKARQIAMYLTQKYTSMSSSQIGLRIGKRDHSTVLHACSAIEKRISVDKDFRKEVESIEREILKN